MPQASSRQGAPTSQKSWVSQKSWASQQSADTDGGNNAWKPGGSRVNSWKPTGAGANSWKPGKSASNGWNTSDRSSARTAAQAIAQTLDKWDQRPTAADLIKGHEQARQSAANTLREKFTQGNNNQGNGNGAGQESNAKSGWQTGSDAGTGRHRAPGPASGPNGLTGVVVSVIGSTGR